MVATAETTSTPDSRRRFLRTGLRNVRAASLVEKSVSSAQSVVPESTVPPVPMSIAHKPRSGLCLGGEDPLLLPDMAILRHRHLGSCLDIDRCSLVIERSADPTKEQGGDENLYRYTGNDPVNNLDPSGHKTQDHKTDHTPQPQPAQNPNTNVHPTAQGTAAHGSIGTGHKITGDHHPTHNQPSTHGSDGAHPVAPHAAANNSHPVPGQNPMHGRPAPVNRENEIPQSTEFRTKTNAQLKKAGFSQSQIKSIDKTQLLQDANEQLRKLGFKGPLDYGHLLIVPIYVKVFGKETEILYISNGQTSVYRLDEADMTGGILSRSRRVVTDTVWYGNNWKAVEQHFAQLGAVMQIAQAAVTALAVSMQLRTDLPEEGVSKPLAGNALDDGTVERGGLTGNLRGAVREAQVAKIVGGKVSGEEVAIPGVARTDIDVVAPNGDLIYVGGPAKAKNLGQFVQALRVYEAMAAKRGVKALAYFAEGTPSAVLEKAADILGKANVHIFTEGR